MFQITDFHLLLGLQIQIVQEGMIILLVAMLAFLARWILLRCSVPSSTTSVTAVSIIGIHFGIVFIVRVPLIFDSVIFAETFHCFPVLPLLMCIVLWIWALVSMTLISEILRASILHIFIIVHMGTHIWLIL